MRSHIFEVYNPQVTVSSLWKTELFFSLLLKNISINRLDISVGLFVASWLPEMTMFLEFFIHWVNFEKKNCLYKEYIT